MTDRLTSSFSAALAERGLSIEALKATVAERVSLGDGDFAFVAGSLAEGLSTPTSDLDLFVVGGGTDAARLVSTFDLGTARVDLERWSISRVKNMLSKLRSTEVDRDPNDSLAGYVLSYGERDFLHRLQNSVCLHNYAAWDELRSDICTRRLSRMKFDYSLSRYNSSLEDALGFYWLGDFDSALLRSQRMLSFLGELLLAAGGETNPVSKWNLMKVRQVLEARNPGQAHAPPPVLEHLCRRYLSLSLVNQENPRSAQSTVHAVARYANLLIPWAQTHFYSRLADDQRILALLPIYRVETSEQAGTRFPALHPAGQFRYFGTELVFFSLCPHTARDRHAAAHKAINIPFYAAAMLYGSCATRYEATCLLSRALDISESDTAGSLHSISAYFKALNLLIDEQHKQPS